MFELTKMNTSGIGSSRKHLYINDELKINAGYKMRNPIVKTLQARSQAIRNALNWYNTAAAALNPPQRLLAWDKVIDYTFLLMESSARSRCKHHAPSVGYPSSQGCA
jgi:hypothetical protein